MAKHTPGPWRVVGEGNRVCRTDTTPYTTIAEVEKISCGGSSLQDSEGYANAQLIAAAPELFSAIVAIFGIASTTAKAFPNAAGNGDWQFVKEITERIISKVTAK